MELLKKREIIVLNKTDLLDKSEVDKKIKIFNKNKKNTVILLSTFDKKSVSKLKAKLLNYVS